jgi:sucrose-6-phosphate hydrolase SacC (GH32 family)
MKGTTMIKTKKTLPAIVLIAAGMMNRTAAYGADEPWSGVWKLWSFADDSGCTVEGAARTGVKLDGAEREASLSRGGDGLAARLAGGSLLAGSGPEALLDYEANDSVTFHVRCKPDGVLDGSLLTQWPGSRSDAKAPLIDLAAWERRLGRLSNRNLFFATGQNPAGELPGAVTPLESDDEGWLDIVVTQQPGRKPGEVITRVYINGVLRSESELTLLGNDTVYFPQPSPVGLRIGGDPGGQFPFRGLIDHVAVWKRALAEDEIAALSGTAELTRRNDVAPVIHRGIPHRFYFDASVPEEKQRETYAAALCEHLVSLLENDPHFPAFHLSGLPSSFNNHAFTWKGRHHFFPIANPMGRHHYRHSWFYYNHLSSDDMVLWTLEPQLRFLDEAGEQREYWPNASFFKGPKGEALCLAGYVGHASVAADDSLREWNALPKCEFVNPAPEPDAAKWRDYAVFQVPGDSLYYMAGFPSREDERSYLYSSSDLRKWDYIGIFSEMGHQECPAIFRLGDRLAFPNFSPKGLSGQFTSGRAGYAVGRFEEMHLKVEHVGVTGYTIRPTVNFPQTDSEGEFVAFWQSINGIGQLSYRQDSRKGYGWSYSMPQQVVRNDDSSLSFYPLDALKALRGARHQLAPSGLAGQTTDIPGAKGNRQEIEIKARLDGQGSCGLVLKQGGHEVRFTYDAEKKVVCLDPSRLSLENSEEHRRMRTCPLELPAGGELEMRCFFDGSVFDAYVNGTYYSTWVLFDDPREVQAGVICENAELKAATAWDMKTAYQLRP